MSKEVFGDVKVLDKEEMDTKHIITNSPNSFVACVYEARLSLSRTLAEGFRSRVDRQRVSASILLISGINSDSLV